MSPISLFRPVRRPRTVLLLLATAGLLVTGVAGNAVATDPYVGGQAATRVSQLPPVAAGPAVERATQAGRSLGLPTAARRTVERVDDLRAAVAFDEVTDLDSRGRPSAVLRFGTDGRLVAVLRLGWEPGHGRALTTDVDATAAALGFAQAVGIKPVDPAVARDDGASGWSVVWERVVDGVPVPGDGVRVQLWRDGSFHSLSRTEHDLADRPATLLEVSVAQATVTRLLDTWIPAERRADVRIDGVALAWMASNDTFEPDRPDAPSAMRHLAWVVQVRSDGPFAEVLRGVDVSIDAADGSVLGGDVLR